MLFLKCNIGQSTALLELSNVSPVALRTAKTPYLLHSEWPKLYGVLAILSAVGLIVDRSNMQKVLNLFKSAWENLILRVSLIVIIWL